MAIPSIQQLIDAGVEFTEVTRKQADSFVKQLVQAGDLKRSDAEAMVQQIVDRGRETSDRISANVQREVAKQVGWLSERFDELEDRFEALAETLADKAPKAAVSVVATRSVSKAPAKKAPAKKAPAKKAPAKKVAAPGSDS